MAGTISPWAPGSACEWKLETWQHSRWQVFTPDGPVLDRTELYLLSTELMLNPILSDKSDKLQFHLVTGLMDSHYLEGFCAEYRVDRLHNGKQSRPQWRASYPWQGRTRNSSTRETTHHHLSIFSLVYNRQKWWRSDYRERVFYHLQTVRFCVLFSDCFFFDRYRSVIATITLRNPSSTY